MTRLFVEEPLASPGSANIDSFKQIYQDHICEGCRKEKSTTTHTLKCPPLLGNNQLVTCIPDYMDIYKNDVEEQAYVVRILKDNLRRLPTSLQ